MTICWMFTKAMLCFPKYVALSQRINYHEWNVRSSCLSGPPLGCIWLVDLCFSYIYWLISFWEMLPRWLAYHTRNVSSVINIWAHNTHSVSFKLEMRRPGQAQWFICRWYLMLSFHNCCLLTQSYWQIRDKYYTLLVEKI